MSSISFVAEQLNKLMKQRDVTEQELADATGISRTTIYYLCKGRGGKPVNTSAENIGKLAEFFRVPTEQFFKEEADQSLVQRKMSVLVADIADIAQDLAPVQQRQLREIGRALSRLDTQKDKDTIYEELMDLVLALTEMDGGTETLKQFLAEVESLAAGSSSPPVERGARRGKPRTGRIVSGKEQSQGDT